MTATKIILWCLYLGFGSFVAFADIAYHLLVCRRLATSIVVAGQLAIGFYVSASLFEYAVGLGETAYRLDWRLYENAGKRRGTDSDVIFSLVSVLLIAAGVLICIFLPTRINFLPEPFYLYVIVFMIISTWLGLLSAFNDARYPGRSDISKKMLKFIFFPFCTILIATTLAAFAQILLVIIGAFALLGVSVAASSFAFIGKAVEDYIDKLLERLIAETAQKQRD